MAVPEHEAAGHSFLSDRWVRRIILAQDASGFQSFIRLYRTLYVRSTVSRIPSARSRPYHPAVGDLTTAPSPLVAFCNRHYAVLGAAVLGLAAFNLLFRLGHEV